MYEFVKNFEKMYGRDDLFEPASEQQVERLQRLFGTRVDKIVGFYKDYQPFSLPMLESCVSLLNIDRIVMENKHGEPGRYLAQYGVYTVAVTAGGNVVCIDTNDSRDGDARVLIADSAFCSYNPYHDCVEIGIAPRKIRLELGQSGIIALNYANIRKCLNQIEPSYLTFLEKLSRNEYEDIEDYLW